MFNVSWSVKINLKSILSRQTQQNAMAVTPRAFNIFNGTKFAAPLVASRAISIGASSTISKPIFSIKFGNRSERIFLSDLLRANVSAGGILYVYTSQVVKLDYTGTVPRSQLILEEKGNFLPPPAARITLFASLNFVSCYSTAVRCESSRFHAAIPCTGGSVWM